MPIFTIPEIGENDRLWVALINHATHTQPVNRFNWFILSPGAFYREKPDGRRAIKPQEASGRSLTDTSEPPQRQ